MLHARQLISLLTCRFGIPQQRVQSTELNSSSIYAEQAAELVPTSLVTRPPGRRQPEPSFKAELKRLTGLHHDIQASAVYPGSRGLDVRSLPAMATISDRRLVNNSVHFWDA